MAMSPSVEADIALCARRWHEHGRAAAAATLEMVCWLNDALAWEQAALAGRVQATLAQLTQESAAQPRFAAPIEEGAGAIPRFFALRLPLSSKQLTLNLLRQLPQVEQVVDLMAYDRHEQHGVVVVASRWSLAQFSDFVAQAHGMEVARLVSAVHDHRARTWLAAHGGPTATIHTDEASGNSVQPPARERNRA